MVGGMAWYFRPASTTGPLTPATTDPEPARRRRRRSSAARSTSRSRSPTRAAGEQAARPAIRIVLPGALTAMEQVELPSQVPGPDPLRRRGDSRRRGPGGRRRRPSWRSRSTHDHHQARRDREITDVLPRASTKGEVVGQDADGRHDRSRQGHRPWRSRQKIVKLRSGRPSPPRRRRRGATAADVRAERLCARQGGIAEEELGAARELTKIKLDDECIAEAEATSTVAKIELSRPRSILQPARASATSSPSSQLASSRRSCKQRGDAVKEQEPVMHLAEPRPAARRGPGRDPVRAAADAGNEGDSTSSRARRRARSAACAAHAREITAVAVTDADNPLIVSGSEDRSVCVWDRRRRPAARAEPRRRRSARSPAARRAPNATCCVAGCADGKIFCGTSTRRKTLKPRQNSLAQRRRRRTRDAVTALAFSPDGTYFASGLADGSIKIWITDDGKDRRGKYAFVPSTASRTHIAAPVTSLHFTPQCRLVSAGRDNTLRVWELHEKGAVARRRADRRPQRQRRPARRQPRRPA